MKEQKSLRYLAKQLGVSPSYLSQVRSGKRPPSRALLMSLHKVLSNERRNVKQSSDDGFDLTAPNRYNIPNGPLAQLAEQLTLNQPVGGSSPPRLRFDSGRK
jgi:transcriptional regulator with XRE-family HTH domain